MKTNNLLKGIMAMVMILIVENTIAQQQVQFTQYMYNTMSVNPAYAGTSNKLEAHAIHRSQWVGLDGAPTTQNIGIQGAATNEIGLGLNVTNDRIGPVNQVYINGNLAARIPLSSNVKLSVGLNGGMDMLSIDWTKGKVQNTNDLTMQNNINNRVRPIIGAGTYVYGESWYIGISSPNFIQEDSYGRDNEVMIHSNVHWYFIGGSVFQLSDRVKLKPAVLGKIVQGAPLTVDVSANALFSDIYTVGMGYRYNDGLSLLLGMTIKKSFFVGYSYDATVTQLRGYNNGSHDIILKYSLLTKEQGARSPRFF